MEATSSLLHSTGDQESVMWSYKKTRNPKRNNQYQTRPFIPSRTSSTSNLYDHPESFPKMEMMVNGGVFFNPPLIPLSSSSSSSNLPRLNSSPYPLQFHQPPLLPLPVASSSCSSRQFRSLPNTSGGATHLSPSHKKQINKGNKHQPNYTKPSKQLPTKSVVANRLRRPSPECQAKDLKKAIAGDDNHALSFIPKFSGLVFPESPPPSSLPMPKFSLKPKMSCGVEATTSAGGGLVDTSGSLPMPSNLCRLLSLR